METQSRHLRPQWGVRYKRWPGLRQTGTSYSMRWDGLTDRPMKPLARTTSAVRRTPVRAPRRLVAHVDPLRFEQVLTNLLDNAAKFSPRSESIEVELSETSLGMLRVAVTDRGPGIPPEGRAHIFDRFYQAHAGNHAFGMGLGLYICRQIVEQHGGLIGAEFPSEGGTRFVFSLPVGIERSAEEPPAASA
jgi:signal transduction histidine kinase